MKYLTQRLALMVPILWAVTTLVFFLIHMVPGDPVDLILGEQALAADRELFRRALRLDQPVWTQYTGFLAGLAHGDLGVSLFDRRPVVSLLLERYPATLELAFAAMVLAFLISVPLGMLASVRKDTAWDRGSMLAALVGISLPHIWLGPLLVLFLSVKLGLFPASGREGNLSLFLPAFTLGSGMAAILTRMIRTQMVETLKEDYVRTAWAKGVGRTGVWFRHALRNALNPVVTIAGLQFGALLAGAIVTEKIFAWPGVGSLMVQALERRDYPVVQGALLTIAFTYSFVNLATDLIYSRIDPRITLGRAGGLTR